MKTKFIKYLSIFIIVLIAYSTNGQTYSIGDYNIHLINNEYCFIFDGDILRIDTHVITVKFFDHVTEVEKENFRNSFNLTYKVETSGGYINYRLPDDSDFITLCESINQNEYLEEFIISSRNKFSGFYTKWWGIWWTMVFN